MAFTDFGTSKKLKEEIKKLKKEKEEIKESMQCTLAFLEECKARNFPGEKK